MASSNYNETNEDLTAGSELNDGLGKLSDSQFAILQAKETMKALIEYEKQYASGSNVKAINERIIGFADFIKARLSEMKDAKRCIRITPNYFQPDHHACAARHHRLYRFETE